MPRSKSEHALALFKAGLSAAGPIGGIVANLIGEYVQTHTEHSRERAIELLRSQIKELENRLDPDTVNKDEFAELFKTVYLTIVRTHQEEKLHAATALIANILLRDGDPEKLSYTELDHHARCIDALSIGAINVLGNVVDIVRQSTTGGLEKRSFNISFDLLQQRMVDTEPSLLMGLLAELNSWNLVHLPGAPTVRTADYSNYNIEIPPLGIGFVLRLLKPGNPKE